RTGRIGDRHTHGVAPFRPRAIIEGHVVAQDLAQHKPSVAGPLADAAIDNHWFAAVHAHGSVKFTEILNRFERAILLNSLRPRNIDRTGDVASAHGQFRHTIRRKNFTGIFTWPTDIKQDKVLLSFDHRPHVV